MDPNTKNLIFSFYGFNVEVTCEDTDTLKNIKRDYSYFLKEDVLSHIRIEVFNQAPDYSCLPPVKASLYTPRNVCYRNQDTWYIDYFGKGLTIVESSKLYKVYSAESHLRHEIVFLTILSSIGQYFDSKELHRVHGLGLEVNGKGLLLLLPSGGGKTTLLMQAIKHDFIKLISEDSPLIDSMGRALPFPLRIGICKESKPKDIPEDQMHLIMRMEFDPKYLIDVDYFKDKIAQNPVPVGYILCGVRCLGPQSSIKPLSKFKTLKLLVRDMVVGIGLYQGIEFLFRHNLLEVIYKFFTVLSRFNHAICLLRYSKTYMFVIGSDQSKNLETLLNFCQQANEQ